MCSLSATSLYLKFAGQYFFYNEWASTEIYTLSLHDALPICLTPRSTASGLMIRGSERTDSSCILPAGSIRSCRSSRSEEHTSELQSHVNLVCRLLLEKKNDESRIERARRSTACSSNLFTNIP